VRSILTTVLVAAAPTLAAAQSPWALGVEIGIERYWGASGPLAGSDELAVRPYRPTHIAVRLDRSLGGVRAAFTVRYAQAAIGGEYEGGATIFSEGFVLLELAPEAAVPIARFGRGAALSGFAGPVVRFWAPADESTRTRVGGRGGLELDAPLTARVSAVTRAHVAIAGSPLEEVDVPAGYEVRSMPSAGVAIGVRVGF
jgi:hypothetical protein